MGKKSPSCDEKSASSMPPGVKPFSKVKRGQLMNCERLGIPQKKNMGSVEDE
jgi:hypothetical protein